MPAETRLEFKNKGSFDLLTLYEDLVGAKAKFEQINETSEYAAYAQVGGINLVDGKTWHVRGAVHVSLFANNGEVYQMQLEGDETIPLPDGGGNMISPAYIYINEDGRICNPVPGKPLIMPNPPLGDNHIPILRLLSNLPSYRKYHLNKE